MPFDSPTQAEDFIFSSYMRVASDLTGPDALTRLPALTRRLLDRLGRPDRAFTSILVTGSKGKGSISLLTAKLLQSLGYRVGLVTSPHVVDFRERIRLNGHSIPAQELVKWANELEGPARQIMESLTGRQYLSPTGLILALAALYFQAHRVDFAVIEAGRGGRFDDCAVLDNPLALFGPMMLEHTDKLGGTLEEIAAHKVVLLKSGGVGVSVPQSEAVQRVMYQWAGQVGGQLFGVGQEIEILNSRIEGNWLETAIKGRVNRFDDLALPIPALYEAENLAVALAAIEIVQDERVLSAEKIGDLRSALAQVSWPGRMQIVADEPLTLLDCAVTRQSARSVLDSLDGRRPGPVVAIVGVPSDRDWRGVLDELNGRCDQLIVTGLVGSRLSFPDDAAAYARQIFPPDFSILETTSFTEAYTRLTTLQPPPRTVLILGTQSVIAQALKFFGASLEDL